MLSPRLNDVMPDLFGNTLLFCQELTTRGCRRIGLVVVAEHDVRVNHRVLAAFLWHSRFGGGKTIPPLIVPQYDPDRESLHRWIEEHAPDAIVTNSEFTIGRIHDLVPPRQRRGIGLATTTLLVPAAARFPGIVDNAPEVGAAAVEIVAAMIQGENAGRRPSRRRPSSPAGSSNRRDGVDRSGTARPASTRSRRRGTACARRARSRQIDPGRDG